MKGMTGYTKWGEEDYEAVGRVDFVYPHYLLTQYRSRREGSPGQTKSRERVGGSWEELAYSLAWDRVELDNGQVYEYLPEADEYRMLVVSG